jgi:hypothetical protein
MARDSPQPAYSSPSAVPTISPTGRSSGVYRHDPYRVDTAPHGTLHPSLWGRVTFVPYPTTSFRSPIPPPPDSEHLKKVFVGQLPYFITEMQLAWMSYVFGGQVLAHPEPIKKRRPDTGELHPTGCVYGYTTQQGFDALVHALHKRTLVDDTGVWHAQTATEFAALSQYVVAMKNDRSLRAQHRPYDTVVVQLANVEQEQMRQSTSPPPSYEASVSQLPPPYFADSQHSHGDGPASSPIVPHP